MQTLLLAANDQSVVRETSFWDTIWVGGIVLCVIIGFLAGSSFLGRIGVSVGLVVAWAIVFTPIWFIGTAIGAAAEHYVSVRDDTLVEDVRHGRDGPEGGSESMPPSSYVEAP